MRVYTNWLCSEKFSLMSGINLTNTAFSFDYLPVRISLKLVLCIQVCICKNKKSSANYSSLLKTDVLLWPLSGAGYSFTDEMQRPLKVSNTRIFAMLLLLQFQLITMKQAVCVCACFALQNLYSEFKHWEIEHAIKLFTHKPQPMRRFCKPFSLGIYSTATVWQSSMLCAL